MSFTEREIRGRELVLVFLLYSAFTAWLLWPLPWFAATHLLDQGTHRPLILADLHLMTWVLSWGAHALATQPWDLFAANSFFPSTASLAYSEHLFGYAPIFAPTYWLTGNPILAVNVVTLLIFPLRGLAMYAFARLFAPSAAAFFAGFLYAFQPEAFEEHALMKFYLLGVFYLPLVFYFTERWLETAHARWAVLLCVALFLQATSSFYLGYALVLAYGAYLPLALFGWRSRLDRRRIVGLVLAGGTAVLGAGLLGLPYLSLKELGLVPEYETGQDAPVGLVMSSSEVRIYLAKGGVGWIGYVLSAVALLPAWRGRGRALAIGIALVVVGLVFSAGPDPVVGETALWTPYRFLMEWLPGFSTIRLSARFLFIAQLGFALLAALGIARLIRRLPAKVAWAGCIALGAVFLLSRSHDRMPVLEHPTGDTVPAAYRWLAEHGEGRALLEFPRPSWSNRARRMLLSTFHWLPIVDGYSAYPPGSDDQLHEIARKLPDERALQRLVDNADIGWVLVHGKELPPGALDPWLGELPPGLEREAVFESDVILRVTRDPVVDRRAKFLSTSETLSGLPRSLVEAPCPGEIRLSAAPPQPWTPGRETPVEITVHNAGSAPWPAEGVMPKHLVRLHVCFERRAEIGCRGNPRPLPRDVLPGKSVTKQVTVWAPRAPGKYTLVVDLRQVGGPRLATCGVQPLRVPVTVAKSNEQRRQRRKPV